VSAFDNVAVTKVALAVDGSTVATDTSSPFTFNIDTTQFADGAHTLTAIASDAAGNSSRAQEPVTVHNNADIKAPSNPSGLKLAVAGTTQAALFWSPSTDNVGVAGYSVYRDGVQIAQTTVPNFLDTGLNPGTSHVYSVRAFDSAGNVSNASSNLNGKTPALSTSATGTLAGVIYNSVGKPVANVVVTLTGNGLTKSVKTNNTGVYKFSSLPAGMYTLTFATSGTTAAASPPVTTVTAVPGQTVVLIAAS
jgi:hypothetical protein